MRKRMRYCTNPPPAGDGKYCSLDGSSCEDRERCFDPHLCPRPTTEKPRTTTKKPKKGKRDFVKGTITCLNFNIILLNICEYLRILLFGSRSLTVQINKTIDDKDVHIFDIPKTY